MDSAALPSLTPLLDGVDRWGELLPLLPVLVALELILSADNAIALAAIARQQHDRQREQRALNIGIALAFVLRIALIVMAQWVLAFRPLQWLAGSYLLWLFVSHWRQTSTGDLLDSSDASAGSEVGSGHATELVAPGMARTVLALALTDLAFSIDSVAAAVAISDQLLLVISGALIGVIALRFTAGLFVRWLELYPRLETAGYSAVGFVGLKLIVGLLLPGWPLPEWLTLVVVATLVLWGFSIRSMTLVEEP
jgi:YkoY family integral membrane protein